MGLNEKFFKTQSGDGSDNFNIVTYGGNGGTKNITGVGFEPSFTWIKARDNGGNNHLFTDSIRGLGVTSNVLGSNLTETTNFNFGHISAFGSDGFTVAQGSTSGNYVNSSSATYVAWNWYAPTSQTNNAGSNGATISSTIKKNVPYGFSIVKWTTSGSVGTVAHGLDSAPELIIGKGINWTSSWPVFALPSGKDKKLSLNDTIGEHNSDIWGNTLPTATTFKQDFTGTANRTNIAYCFHSVDGYQKVGSYVGGGSSSNPTVTCGFEPRFLMVKKATGTMSGSTGWTMVDNVRHPGTPTYVNGNVLYADSPISEQDDDNLRGFIITSTGFSPNGNYVVTNNENDTYIFLAIA